MNPYYEDEFVTLYLGDFQEILPVLNGGGAWFDAAIVDPPYGQTSLAWDRWIPELPSAMADVTDSLWCFGSMRMFLDRAADFAGWKFAEDIVWEKHNGSSFHTDRFRRVHESAVHWYRGAWSEVYKAVPTTADATKRTVRRKERPAHMGAIANSTYSSADGGPRRARSVIRCRSMHGSAHHPTEKPGGIILPLIENSVPVGGRFIDPTAGVGSSLVTGKLAGRRSVGIEINEPYCEIAATRLSQELLMEGAPA